MKNVIVIDVHERGYLVEETILPSGVSGSTATALLLPSDTAERKRSFLKTLPELGCAAKDKLIVVGRRFDPFGDAGTRFSRTLALLDRLVDIPAELVCVQTRSPYILLALPVLRALGSKVVAVLAVEALESSLSRRATLGSPNPAERVRTAAALKKLGIATVIQWAPLISEGQGDTIELETSAKTLLSAAHAVRVAPYESLLEAYRPERRFFIGGLLKEADSLAAQFLRRTAPDAFLGYASPANHQAAA